VGAELGREVLVIIVGLRVGCNVENKVAVGIRVGIAVGSNDGG
jgi:hypothetical protein